MDKKNLIISIIILLIIIVIYLTTIYFLNNKKAKKYKIKTIFYKKIFLYGPFNYPIFLIISNILYFIYNIIIISLNIMLLSNIINIEFIGLLNAISFAWAQINIYFLIKNY